MNWYGKTLVALALAMIACAAPATARAQTPDLWSVTGSPNARLGLAFPGGDPRFYPLLADAGIGVVRLSASWALLEPERGVNNFAGLDGRILALQRLGISPFLTFESNAEWAVTPNQPVKNATPRNLADWSAFVARIAERYDGDGVNDMPGLRAPVRYFQAANEFNSPTNRSGGWVGAPRDLVSYINAAHDAVKSANPRAVFVLGGIASFNMDILLLDQNRASFVVQQRWSETSRTVFDPADLSTPLLRDLIDGRFQTVVRQARYDWASVHLYGPEVRDIARLGLMRDLTRKPVISTECGGPSLDYGGVYSGQNHFRSVLTRNLNVQTAGAPFCLWFGLGEGITSTFGNARVALYDRRSREKPGVVAYRLMSRLLRPDARVTQPLSGLYLITSDAGRACVSTNAQSHAQAASYCSQQALCVKDAQSQSASVMNVAALPAQCPETGIGLSGQGFWAALENGS